MRALVIGSLLVAVVACTGGDDDDRTAPPVPSATSGQAAVTSTTSPASPATTTSAASSSSTTTELNPVPPTPAPPTAPTTIEVELPPVPTLVPEVPDELLTPEQRDPFNVNNSRPILPEHLPVIEAYLSAIQANTFVASQWPIDVESPVLVSSPLSPEMLGRVQDALRSRISAGEKLNVLQGVTYRPYIVGPLSATAVVQDCELAGHYWETADSGDVVTPNSVWPTSPGEIVEVGLRVELTMRDGQWVVEYSAVDTQACAS